MKESIVVTINGLEYDTYIDERGIQCFPLNRVVSWLVRIPESKINKIWDMANAGLFDKEELMELYILIGYSVSGFSEMFPDAKIENPLWEE